MSLRRAAAALVLAAALAASHGARAETHTVVIQFFQFKPQTIEVKPGDEVEWVNKDSFEHTVTATGNAFDSKAIKAGHSFRWKAGDAGQYPYVCSFHGNMKGVVNVKP
jgi:plastocyanin